MSGLPPFPLLRLPSIVLLTADAPGILGMFGPPQWGIFDQGGQPILVSDAVGGVEYQRQYDVSEYPQEQGAFASYNKVQKPYEATVTLLTSLTRQQLLSIIEPIIASLQLVTVVMPEWGYQSANLTQYQFRRTSRNGVTLIEVEIGCKEIRYANSMLTSSASPQQPPQQQPSQPNTGTDRPVGQVSGESNVGGSGTSSGGANQAGVSTPALDTGSTNAAYPTQSGPVQSVTPSPSAPLPLPERSYLIMGEPLTSTPLPEGGASAPLPPPEGGASAPLPPPEGGASAPLPP